ncbi:MAG: spore coat protein [Clostridia bacterium]|nr:spore coat protein [Clostridia bacterium]
MEDKYLMESLLMSVKGACDLYMHGTIESNTKNVHCAFEKALEEELTIQEEIYKKMAEKGWYPTQQAGQQQIEQVKMRFAAQA